MSWLLSLVVAVLTGLIGLFCSGLAASAYATWFHVSNREGAAGFFIVGMALLGGIAAFIVGLVTSRLIASAGFWKAFGGASLVVVAISGLAILILYLLADFPPRIDGEELRLEVEIRLPVGHPKPSGEGEFMLGSVVNHVQRASQRGGLKVDEARLENGRWIIPARVFLFTKRGLRSISAELNGTNIAGFILPVPARPGKEQEQWSEWGPQPPPGNPPWPDTEPAYRFRVQRIPAPPPRLSTEERQSQEEAEEQAKFDAIPADAPLRVWIPYTQPGMDEPRSASAMERITANPALAANLSALMLDPDPREAANAMHLVGRLPQPSADLIPGVIAAGRDIIARLRKVNSTTVEQDPAFEGAADVSIRFGGWMEAVRTLRAKQTGDFIPELREILELSRVRTDSEVMRRDVRRVASYYLKTWAGVEPLPGDPPPR